MTAVPAHGATPTRPALVAAVLLSLLIPALLTAFLVATAARAEPGGLGGRGAERGTLRRHPVLEPSVDVTTQSRKDVPGT